MAGKQSTVRSRRTATDRRELILEAAARRFAEFGFEATTVRQIADDVDILSGSLYHHFATKEEILEEIVRDPTLSKRDRAVKIANLDADAETRLVTILTDELQALTSQVAAHAIVFNERKFFRRSAYFSYLIKARKEGYEAWSRILVDGVSEGLFQPEIDIFLTISTVTRMLNTGADWYLHEDGSAQDALSDYSFDKLIEFYIGFVLRSIRAPGRAAEPIPNPVTDF